MRIRLSRALVACFAAAWASSRFFLASATFACAVCSSPLTFLTSASFFAVASFQFFEVTKTIVEMPRKIREKAMMTSTRILPTWVMVPSYQSEY